MGDDATFVQAIVDSPFDEALRIIYADWLDEHGDPRGEYLRIEAIFRTLPQDNPKVLAGYKRWRELRNIIDPKWLILMDQRVATPPGIGIEGRRAIETIRKIFIEAKEINTCDCQAFYSPQVWKEQGHFLAEIELPSDIVLIIAYSGGMIGGCFDGFESEKLDEYLGLPENQHIHVRPPVLALRRQITEAFHKMGLVIQVYDESYSMVCTKPRGRSPKSAKR